MNSIVRSVLTSFVACIILFGGSVSGAMAQEATPETDFQRPSSPEDMLLDPTEIGGGWVLVDPMVTTVVNTATWEAAATAVYSGPNGDRIGIAIRYVNGDRDAILAVEKVLDNIFYGYEQYDLTTDGELELPPIAPCDSMRRIEGSNSWWRETGVSSCLIGLDLAIWVEVQGVALGLSGSAASDAVITLMLGE